MDKLISRYKTQILEIAVQRGVQHVRLFGSMVRNEARPDSDVDLLVELQCLASGANVMGIPDLIIAQNALQNECAIYSLDKHFHQLQRIIQIDLFP